MKVAQVIRKCNFKQEAIVHSRNDEGTEQHVGNLDKVVNDISSIDRWTDRIHELEPQTLFMVLCELQAKELA